MTSSPLRFLLVGVCVALVVSGCSGDDPAPGIDPGDSSSAAATPTSAPSPSGPVEPTLAVAAQGDDAAAAEAFVRFYWETVNYAQATGDVDGLRELALSTCAACTGGQDWIRDVYAQGGVIDGGTYEVRLHATTALQAGDRRLFKEVLDVSNTAQRVTGTIDLDRTYPAREAVMEMTVGRFEGMWKVARWETSG